MDTTQRAGREAFPISCEKEEDGMGRGAAARRALLWHRAWVVRPLNLRDPSRATHLPSFHPEPQLWHPRVTGRTCHPRLLPPRPRSRSERASPEVSASVGASTPPGERHGGLGSGSLLPKAAQSSLGGSATSSVCPALRPLLPWWRRVPTRVGGETPCGPLTSGILLGHLSSLHELSKHPPPEKPT